MSNKKESGLLEKIHEAEERKRSEATQHAVDSLLAAKLGAADRDPDGLGQHTPGAKLDAGKARMGLVIAGFADALAAVGEVGTYGAKKYTDDGWKTVDKGVERYTDAMYRHLLAEAHEVFDTESHLRHAAHAAWNALARLQLMIERKQW